MSANGFWFRPLRCILHPPLTPPPAFTAPKFNELIIYELHAGSLHFSLGPIRHTTTGSPNSDRQLCIRSRRTPEPKESQQNASAACRKLAGRAFAATTEKLEHIASLGRILRLNIDRKRAPVLATQASGLSLHHCFYVGLVPCEASTAFSSCPQLVPACLSL